MQKATLFRLATLLTLATLMNKFLFLLLIYLCTGGCGGNEVNETKESVPVSFVSATPPGGCLPANGTIIVTFDGEPKEVSVSHGSVKVSGRIATITGPFDPATLSLLGVIITWADGTQKLRYEFVGCDY